MAAIVSLPAAARSAFSSDVQSRSRCSKSRRSSRSLSFHCCSAAASPICGIRTKYRTIYRPRPAEIEVRKCDLDRSAPRNPSVVVLRDALLEPPEERLRVEPFARRGLYDVLRLQLRAVRVDTALQPGAQ